MTRWTIAALSIVATAGVVLAWTLEPTRTLYAWLVAHYAAYTTAVGALVLLLLGDATDAVWLPVIRRPVEAIASTLPLLVILFVPILLSLELVYPWASGGLALSHHELELVRAKRAWLDEPFFVVRSAVYLLVPAILAEIVRTRGAAAARRRLGAVGLPIVILVATFAGFDWVMSLEPAYYSTAFGLIPTTGGFMAALAILVIVIALAHRRGELLDAGPDHVHAIGKLLLTAVCFWAYLAFFQYMLGWIANLPNEARWYLPRTRGGWGWIAFALIALHFALPFVALLSRALKRRAGALAIVSAGLLVMHWLDLFWQSLPAIDPAAPSLHVADVASVIAVSGAALAVADWRASHSPPRAHPLHERSLRYRSE